MGKVKPIKKRLKIAWVEDDNSMLEENICFLSEDIELCNFETFRENFNVLGVPKNAHLDLRLARKMLTKTNNYDGIILDDMILRKDVYPLDGKEVGEHLLKDIHSHQINQEIPIIMYVHQNDPKKVKIYKKLGANFLVPKSTFQYLQDDIKDNCIILNETYKSWNLVKLIQSARRIRV